MDCRVKPGHDPLRDSGKQLRAALAARLIHPFARSPNRLAATVSFDSVSPELAI
jgi:hypothetical protein